VFHNNANKHNKQQMNLCHKRPPGKKNIAMDSGGKWPISWIILKT
jgi:hypothetical protein